MPLNSSQKGILYAALAFCFWGLISLYWKLLASVSSWELLFHRVIWGSIPLICYLLVTKKFKSFQALKESRVLLSSLLASLLIILNWVIFIWAVSNGHVLEVSLGYFLNPLLNVVLGTLFLEEKLSKFQQGAVALAGVGLAIMFAQDLGAPWISLALASSFSLYGYVRKKNPLAPVQGLCFEMLVGVVVLAPFAGRLFPFEFSQMSFQMQLLSMLAGPVTILPLILFNKAVKLVAYSTVGIIQYLAPTLQFLLAVLVFQENFTIRHAGAFILIWLAVGLYLKESLLKAKLKRQNT
tara:strand:- start:3636 stop:4520 length:885 start_codon:yes stop_codon:yes gene_type:complete